MAATIGFAGQAPGNILCSKAMASLNLASAPFNSSSKFNQCSVRIRQQDIYVPGRINYKLSWNRKVHLIMASTKHTEFSSSLLSSSETIKEFYDCINEKNLEQLYQFISDDCCFDDCSFYKPLQGKKEVMKFFQELITCMGQNLKFNIGHVYEGVQFTAGVTWHLEWKERQVPFTRGCSFCECSKEGERLVIKGAFVQVESPIKLGFLVLVLLKITTSIFDEFPKAAERFLDSPSTTLDLLLKLYSMTMAPFINPIQACYIKLWKILTPLLSYALQIVLYILKTAFK